MTTLYAVFITLHGLAHIWYVVLSLRLVPFQPEMGWSGESWLLTGRLDEQVVRTIASLLYTLATLGFIVTGTVLLLNGNLYPPIMITAAALSMITIALYWDGDSSQLVQKGLVGFLINAFILLLLFALGWPSTS